MGKNKDKKYSSSYEAIAKIVYSVSTSKLVCMKNLFKVILMNYLLKNGDAHLKNFGILYDEEFSNIWFSPAYDVVNSVVYFHKDRPALTMFGKKVWFGKKELVKFGIEHCYLSKKDSVDIYENCIETLKYSIEHLKNYIKRNKNFKKIGQMMCDSWELSLDGKTYKLPNEVIRNWK